MIDFRFYLVTDRTLCAPRSLASLVHDACVTGVRAVQLREKDLPENDLVSAATRLMSVVRPRGARLIINVSENVEDHTASLLAASPGVDGFHVPDDPDLLRHIRGLFPKLIVGASAHTAESVRVAADAGADFVCFGPVYQTPAKRQYGAPRGLDALKAACDGVETPVFAIGGITPETAAACLEAGAYGIAVVSAIMGATSARRAVRAFQEAIGEL
jgi:thiamine-phosphate pyrophosphorylase